MSIAMSKRRVPMLACTHCGRAAYYDMEPDKRCGQTVAGKQCRGRIRFGARIDWTECPRAMRPAGMTEPVVAVMASGGYS
jgi:hypothetical protein